MPRGLRRFQQSGQLHFVTFVFSERKRIEKLRYMHRNPVKRGFVQQPEDWQWSSFRHYVSGQEGIVEIESMWTARRRERAGDVLKVKVNDPTLTNNRLGLMG